MRLLYIRIKLETYFSNVIEPIIRLENVDLTDIFTEPFGGFLKIKIIWRFQSSTSSLSLFRGELSQEAISHYLFSQLHRPQNQEP